MKPTALLLAQNLILKCKKKKLKSELEEAVGAGNYNRRSEIKVCIDAIDYERFNLSVRFHKLKKSEDVDLFIDLD